MSPVLIILLFAGAVLLFVLYIILRAKVQQISLRAFGTRDIREGLSQAEREANDTPRSVSGGDALYLPQILRDFPEFNRELAVSQIETCLRDVFSGIETGQAVEIVSMTWRQRETRCILAAFVSIAPPSAGICQRDTTAPFAFSPPLRFSGAKTAARAGSSRKNTSWTIPTRSGRTAVSRRRFPCAAHIAVLQCVR